MSLIQEALKRQAEEQPAVILPKMPSEPIKPLEEKKRPRPLQIVTIAVLAAGLIAVLAGLGIYLIKPKPHTTVTKTAPAEAAVVYQPVPPEKPVKTTEAVKAEVPSAEPAKKPEPPSATPIEWPRLVLTGIAQGDSQRIAIINGKMLAPGRMLGDVLVKEVHAADVAVEYRGERRILYIGD